VPPLLLETGESNAHNRQSLRGADKQHFALGKSIPPCLLSAVRFRVVESLDQEPACSYAIGVVESVETNVVLLTETIRRRRR
jgi:hypothetical protein